MKKIPFIVTINGTDRVRVWAYDASAACRKAETVYQFTRENPDDARSISAEQDLRSANLEPARLTMVKS